MFRSTACACCRSTARMHGTANDLALVGSKGVQTRFTNWSFGQLCRHVGAPAAYLSTLPAVTASDALNHSLGHADTGKELKVLVYRNGRFLSGRMTGMGYDRIWNVDITKRLFRMQDMGWMVPPARPAFPNQPGSRPATEADCIKQPGFWGEVKPGDIIAPAGLYASDRDMFAFFVNPQRELRAGGSQLFRGVFISNSEVGDKSFRITKFLMNAICGNHIC